ncbi:MAG: ATP-binding cassette domain-containing protein [Pseudomonadota bacterium]
MLQARALGYSRNNETLFESLGFTIYPGQNVAVAGRNGVGKSTLFDLVLGKLAPDTGDLEYPATWQTVYMEQEVEVTDRPALQFVIDGFAELRKVEQQISKLEEEDFPDADQLAQAHARFADLGGYEIESRAATILHGLGFGTADQSRAYAEFSGGWRIRLNLARALLQPSDLLLLDEPTNHLDLEAIVWLEQWLSRYPGTLLLIAHDRSFLDQCTQHTLYLSSSTGKLYSGNYSSCERQRAEAISQAQAANAKREAKAAHIQKFVDRFRAKASKAKQVQSRIKALERMQQSVSLAIESPYSIAFRNPDRVSNPLFSLSRLDLGYNPKNLVLKNVNQSILPGARIGILGENGAGKSTLMKALVGELPATSGSIGQGRHAATGYFAQHQLETLDAQETALHHLTLEFPAWTEQQCRDYLGGWGFNSGMLSRPIQTLSGGEKARFILALLAAHEPAVLVLDEPTNHLDLDMRDALVHALQDYEGAVVIVSHDRTLLSQTIDECWVVASGSVARYTGDIADYAQAVKSAAAQLTTDSAPETDAKSKRELRQARARQRESEKELRAALRRAEKEINKYTEVLRELEGQLADSEIYTSMPADELDALMARAGRYRHRVEQAEEIWLDLSSQLEELG